MVLPTALYVVTGKDEIMEVLEAITSRRSIRNYTGVPISEEQLDTVLRSGFQAPSAHNKQPWHFIVVRDPNSLSSMAELHPYAKMLPSAGCGIVVCGDKKLEGETGFIVEDCSAAIQNMLLAAHGIGLGAVWCGLYPITALTKGIRLLLDIPSDIIPVGLVVVGNKESDRPAVDRYDAERVHSEKW